MSRGAWNLIKQSKNFNVNVYRRALTLLICSLGLSTCLGIMMYYTYVRAPEPDYYATSGIIPPIKLNALMAPNSLSVALLEPDPPTDDKERVMPQ